MNILLIQPPKSPTVIGGEGLHIYEPLELEYVAAGLNSDCKVSILDMRLEKNLIDCLKKNSPDIVGITSYTTHVNTVKNILHKIKSYNSDIVTVVGGHHATALPQDFQINDTDVIVAGEGVYSFQTIVSALKESKKLLFKMINSSNNTNQKIFYSKNNLEDLNNYPLPRRDLTKKYRKKYFSEWMKPLASIITSKGCHYRCDFCCLWPLTNGQYLTRKPKDIVDELSNIEEKNIFFADAESMLDIERMKNVASLIKRRGIQKKYFCYSRSDTVRKHPELFALWRDIGLERVFIGFEFHKDDDLGNMRKGATVADNEKAMKVLNDLDISMISSFLIKPDFSKRDFKEFSDYCQKLKTLYKFSLFLFSVLTPLPGSSLFEKTKSQLITHNYDHFDLFHPVLPTKIPLKEFFRQLHDLYMNLNSPQEMIPTLKKYKMLDIPSNITRYYKVAKQIKNAYKDYW
jgi:radical SAM superfamily enzyme YgiQ (UPF0313 family)